MQPTDSELHVVVGIGPVGRAVIDEILTRGYRVRAVALAPGIVYLADAIGTQTEAAAVRGLSLVHEPLRQLVWGELRTGVLMGLSSASPSPGARPATSAICPNLGGPSAHGDRTQQPSPDRHRVGRATRHARTVPSGTVGRRLP
jgi:hypothetical protein